jgi:5'-deoxynucleotidase YfbR-like HD superfamily hydrolase
MTTMKKPAPEGCPYYPDLLDPQTRVLAFVPRWTIIRTLRAQSVAEHSYFVALYAKRIGELLGLSLEEMAELVWAALVHDADEMITGDVPTPSKKRHLYIHRDRVLDDMGYGEPDISAYSKDILKVADVYEACMFLTDELAMGNTTVERLWVEMLRDLYTKCEDLHPDLYETLASNIHEVERTKLMTANGWRT